MFSLKAKSASRTSAGITISTEGIAIAIVEHAQTGPILEFSTFQACSTTDRASVLSELVRLHHLDNIPCNLVLSPEDYQLTPVDAPEVPKQELSAALHWQIKDLLDFHIDDAILDHISLPNQNTSGKKELLVVATRQSIIQSYVDLLQAAHCNLASIDIAVQSARNIISHLSLNDRSIGLLNLWDNISKLSVLLDDDIYINRTSSIGLQSLAFLSEEDINSQSILDSLALELQRTFDYYESHSRQAAITQLLILNNGKAIDNLAQLIQDRLGIKCSTIDLKDALNFGDAVDSISNHCLIAVGGALRSTN